MNWVNRVLLSPAPFCGLVPPRHHHGALSAIDGPHDGFLVVDNCSQCSQEHSPQEYNRPGVNTRCIPFLAVASVAATLRVSHKKACS